MAGHKGSHGINPRGCKTGGGRYGSKSGSGGKKSSGGGSKKKSGK